MNNPKSLLCVEIEDEFNRLKDLKAGTEEYKSTVDSLTKLTDRLIEMEKFDEECRQKNEDRKKDVHYRDIQLAEDRKDRLVKNCIAIAGIVVPSVITVWGTFKSFKFEQEGTITTIMGRGFINKLLPKK